MKVKQSCEPLFALLKEAQELRVTWQENTYKASNSDLYQILNRCYRIYDQLKSDQSLYQQFSSETSNLGLTGNRRTRLASKIIRLVFQTDRRRCSAYAHVLDVAHRESVPESELADWISHQGGVEEIRRGAQTGVRPREQLKNYQAAAERELAAADEVAEIPANLSEFQPEGSDLFSLAVLRKNPNGTISVVRGVRSCRLTRQALTQIGREVHSKSKIEAESASFRRNKAIRDMLIAAPA